MALRKRTIPQDTSFTIRALESGYMVMNENDPARGNEISRWGFSTKKEALAFISQQIEGECYRAK